MKICPHCHKKNSDLAQFCRLCGTSLKNVKPVSAQSNQVKCPNCGKLNPAEAKFCRYCGAKLMVKKSAKLSVLRPSHPKARYHVLETLGVIILVLLVGFGIWDHFKATPQSKGPKEPVVHYTEVNPSFQASDKSKSNEIKYIGDRLVNYEHNNGSEGRKVASLIHSVDYSYSGIFASLNVNSLSSSDKEAIEQAWNDSYGGSKHLLIVQSKNYNYIGHAETNESTIHWNDHFKLNDNG